ncbi:MAG: DNA internalization-related competence protein ComEC/Rec2 [Desulfobacter sp.]
MRHLLNPVFPPFAPIVLFLAGGILAGRFLPGLPVWYAIAAALFFSLTFFIFFCRSPIVLACCIFAFAQGFISMADIQAPDISKPHISQFSDGSIYEITGKIDSFARHYPGKTKLVLVCKTIEQLGKPPMDTTGRINLNVYLKNYASADNTMLRFGDMIRFSGPLNPIRNFSNPGGYDYKLHMQYREIFGSTYAKLTRIDILEQKQHTVWVAFFRQIEAVRDRFCTLIKSRARAVAQRIEENQALSDGVYASAQVSAKAHHAGALLGALVTGKKELISPELRDLFARAGASHILAISGLHLSIVAFGAFRIFYFLAGRSQRLSTTGAARKLAGILTLGPLFVYALFAGFSPSTQRAFIMTAVFMAAILAERENDGFNTLSIAGILILVVNAAALFSISFQLSFSALIFILLGFRVVRQNNWNWQGRNMIVRLLSGALLVTLFAGIGTFPLIAKYFNMVSHVQVVSNLLFVPVMGFICLPLGFLSLLVMSVFPGLAGGILDLGIEILTLCLYAAEWLAGFEFSWSRIITFTWTQVGLIYLFLAGIYLVAAKRKRAGAWLVIFTLVSGTVSAGMAVKSRFFPGRLAITVLDVGQGNAAVVHTSSGQVLLIDGGGFSGLSGFDTGRYIVAPFLWRNQIKTLDGVILSHPDSDHMNGLVFIMDNFTVRKWFWNHDKNNTKAFHQLVSLAEKKQVPQYFPGPEPVLFDFKGTKLTLFPGETGKKRVSRNNNSLVCRIRYQSFSMLFPGDIDETRENSLGKAGHLSLQSDIMLCPHHGSKGSGSKIFLDKVRPESVIVSCGYNNRYGFPHPEALARYKTRGTRIFRTDLHGAVTITTTGENHHIKTNREL